MSSFEFTTPAQNADDSATQQWRDWELESAQFGGGELTFTYPSGLIATTSPKASLPVGTQIKKLVGHLKNASGLGQQVDVKVYHAGTLIGTLTFPGGQSYAEVDVNVTTGARNTSVWQVEIASPGVNAVGLVVHLARS